MNILIAILILDFIIIIHELGHFLFGKIFNFKIDEFGIGFGKTLLKKKFKETDYAINLLPLGGYIKFDEEDYMKQEGWKKSLVCFAGPLFNYILAFISLSIFIKLTNSHFNLFQSIKGSIILIYTFSITILKELGSIFTNYQKFYNNSGGPINFIQTSKPIISQGLNSIILLIGILSINIGLFNLLPLPMLDGSKVWIELSKIFTKKTEYKWEEKFHMIGVYLLIGLTIIIFIFDIIKLFK